jgi:hypothetical protein
MDCPQHLATQYCAANAMHLQSGFFNELQVYLMMETPSEPKN